MIVSVPCRLLLRLVCFAFLAEMVAVAQTVPATPSPRESVHYATSILLRHLPPVIEGDKGWGDTKTVWTGVDMKIRHGKLRTHRRTKEVDHGHWIQYQIDLPAGGLRMDEHVHIHAATPDLNVPGRYQISIGVDAPIRFEVRNQRHVRGVRLHSTTVDGSARVQMDVTAVVTIYSDLTEIPPAIVIDPVVQTATLRLRDFEVNHISRLGGDAAEAWGDLAEATLIESAIDRSNETLVEKLQKAVDKNRDDLRLSPRDLMRRILPVPTISPTASAPPLAP